METDFAADRADLLTSCCEVAAWRVSRLVTCRGWLRNCMIQEDWAGLSKAGDARLGSRSYDAERMEVAAAMCVSGITKRQASGVQVMVYRNTENEVA
jgi:hypothetical protein